MFTKNRLKFCQLGFGWADFKNIFRRIDLGQKSSKLVSHNQVFQRAQLKNQGLFINGTNDKATTQPSGDLFHCTEVRFTIFLSLEFTIEV